MPRGLFLAAAALAAFLLFGSVLHCDRSGPVPSPRKPVAGPDAGRPAFPSPLMTYIQEKRYLKRQSRQREVQAMREVHVSRREADLLRRDFAEMHGLLKDGVRMFGEGKMEEALQEFQRVIVQHPEDAHLVCIATKNMAVVCRRLERKEEYLKHFKRYYELLLELPEDEDDL